MSKSVISTPPGESLNETSAGVSFGSLGGKEGPVNPVRLARANPQELVWEQRTKSVSSGRGEFEAPLPFELTPLTGRDTEFSLLKNRWEQAQEGMRQVVLVVGQPILGKSRPVQTLTQRVQAHASDASLTGWRIRELRSTRTLRSSNGAVHNSRTRSSTRVSDYLERFLWIRQDPSEAFYGVQEMWAHR
jgi:hypothetical protein